MNHHTSPIWAAIGAILFFGLFWTVLDLITGKFKRK
jgi:hypothetical protein